MSIREYTMADREAIITLIAAFRVELALLRRRQRALDLAAATEELQDHLDRGFPIFIASGDTGGCIGYLVCRVDGNTVWAESLFVSPEYRRRGIGTTLYAAAERLARDRGSPTVYNWVHPNNDRIIAFLKERGYEVLNLIEVRRPTEGEQFQGTLRIADHDYKY
jgi:ribosomal protein S18 acetylase RimI-like enzyme